MSLDRIFEFIILVTMANVLYCGAFLPDIAVQLSDFHEQWLRWRWLLFAIGTLLASTITQFVSRGLFSGL